MAEPITGTSGPNTLTGTLGDDIINALGGSDTINASQGTDQVDGGTGTDTLVINMFNGALFAPATGSRTYTFTPTGVTDSSGTLNTSMTSIERIRFSDVGNGDFDNIVDASAITPASGFNLMQIRMGNGDDTVIGSSLNDTVWTGLGSNIIDTGAGTDRVVIETDNSSGSTTYVTSSGNMVVTTENGIQTNAVTNSEIITFQGLIVGGVSRVDASGFDPIAGTQLIFSDLSGSEIFIGSSGDDWFAIAPSFTLGFGVGTDVFTGGGGADHYDYTFAVDNLDGDTITDFDSEDVIDLNANNGEISPLLCNRFIGAAAFSGVAGQYRYEASGGQTLLQVDTDGDAVADTVLTFSNGAFALAETEQGSNIIVLANQVNGTDGNDRLPGTPGDDSIYGGNGNDILKGQLGDDLIDGGAGVDRAGYWHDNVTLGGVTVSLQFQGTAQNVGGLGWDTLTGIENVFGTPFADSLTGDDGNNWLSGSEATIDGVGVSTENNDYLDGAGGDDLLTVGVGNHTIIGGTGNDALWFSENGFPETTITVSLALQGVAQATGNGSWTLFGIENLTGGIANDMLTGDGSANVLGGGAGNDMLIGGAGHDVLYGDGGIAVDGNDVITTFVDVATIIGGGLGSDVAMMPGVSGNDMLEGGLGDDQLWGGGGADTANYEHAAGAVTVTLNNNLTGNGTVTGADGNDTLNSIENVTGSAFNDTITGSSAANVLSGGDGHDMLQARGGDDSVYGGDGDDYLGGGTGNDLLDGGAGYDRVSFSNGSTGPVTVDLRIQGAQNTGLGLDTLIGIEHLSGTAFGDTLIGNSGDNWLWGAGSGNDIIDGQEGNDLIEDGAGDLTLAGGDGIDTFKFNPFLTSSGATISLALQGAAQDTGAGMMTLTGFENLSGSDFDDTLIGDGDANLLAGSAGNDTLVGGAGNDTLFGDGMHGIDNHGATGSGPITFYTDVATLGGVDGDDLLEGGEGDDQLYGGGGSDTASFEHSSGAVTITLFNNLTGNGTATGADGDDTLNSIENVIGSAYNDSITGSAASNVLAGGDGRDFLQARGGDDSVYGGNGDDFLGGGTGNDLLDGGAGWDRVSFANGSIAPVTVDLRIQGVAQNTGLGMDTLVDIEHASGTAFGDTLIGNSGDNWLWGGSDGSGNDTIDGQEGNDLIETGAGDHVATGGDGNDTFRFNPFNTTSGATISLALQGAAQNTGAGMVTLTGFENLSGSVFGDTLIGDGGNNVLAGNGDGDTLIGGAGNDTLYGDGEIRPGIPGANSGPITTYADVASIGGFDGNDLLEGGLGDDLIDGGGGIDTASFAHAGGAVTIDLGGGFAFGADGSDTLLNVENATGSGFNDSITGGATANILVGGAGNDSLNGAGGDDTLVGGTGNDIFDGGAGVDTIDYSASSAAVSINLNSGKLSGGDAAGDTVSNVENIVGSAFTDKLVGSAASNTLNGGAGNDTVTGGAGADLLFGGNGSDTFGFTAIGDFGSLGNTDRIVDFEAGGSTAATRVDVIDLSAIDANSKTATKDDAFTFIGLAQFSSKAGQLRYDAAAGLLSGDVNGDGVADFSLAITLLGGTLDGSDFAL